MYAAAITTEPLRTLSLFSCCGGGDEGFHRAGIETAVFCEIDPAACAVQGERDPHTPILGDITAVAGGRRMRQWLVAEGYADVDLGHSSSPCQDLSVAGARAGLAGLRS